MMNTFYGIVKRIGNKTRSDNMYKFLGQEHDVKVHDLW
jgi:hypothetical protein